MAVLNYAKQYQQALEQQFPYALYFGALFSTPNNGRYLWVTCDTIQVPTISTTGRVDGDRDTIGTKKRNFNNQWTPLTVTNHRTWSTLVHPRDIDQTNEVASIANITRVYNDEQKIPEMDAYCPSCMQIGSRCPIPQTRLSSPQTTSFPLLISGCPRWMTSVFRVLAVSCM